MAAVAVIASLLFVGRQISQNTAAQRYNAEQGYADSWQDILMGLANSPSLTAAYNAVIRGDADEDQTTQVQMLCASMLKRMEANHHQWQSGNLDDELWQAAYTAFVAQIEIQPYFRTMLTGDQERYLAKDFFALCQQALAEAEAGSVTDISA